jgi:hypothetical protein
MPYSPHQVLQSQRSRKSGSIRRRADAGSDQAATLVALGNEFEDLVLAQIAEVVEHEDVEAVELGQGSGQHEIAPRRLKLLHEIGSSAEEDAFSLIMSAVPIAAARCVLPVPLGPKIRRLPRCLSQASPSASAITCALRMVGTAAGSSAPSHCKKNCSESK